MDGGSTVSRLEPLRGGSLLFTTKFPEILGTHFIDLVRMKGSVDLGPIGEPLKKFKSSRLHMFFKVSSIKNSAIFTGKLKCWGLMSKGCMSKGLQLFEN